MHVYRVLLCLGASPSFKWFVYYICRATENYWIVFNPGNSIHVFGTSSVWCCCRRARVTTRRSRFGTDSSYDSENDTCGVFFLLGSSFLSAYYVHPSLNSMKSATADPPAAASFCNFIFYNFLRSGICRMKHIDKKESCAYVSAFYIRTCSFSVLWR